MDLKLFTKILAGHLIPSPKDYTFGPSGLHAQQRGEGLDDLCTCGSLYHVEGWSNFYSLHRCRDINRVDWSFSDLMLEAIGQGPHMIGWIGCLYSSQVRVIQECLPLFSIRNVTRQGCPVASHLYHDTKAVPLASQGKSKYWRHIGWQSLWQGVSSC